MDAFRIPDGNPSLAVSMRDIPYRVTNGRELRALLYRPAGEGLFPAVVCVHGGAWVSGDRTATQGFAELFAACGIVVMAIDFRMAPQNPYPAALTDIHYAICWLKANARALSVAPDMIGGLGVSSGGHLILLSAMRPEEPRYSTALQLQAERTDARMAFAVTCSGVLDPLARYRMAQARGDQEIMACHEAFFGNETIMAEASPPLILERGEPAALPPALFFQGGEDPRLPPDTAQRMASLYQAAGGYANPVVYEGMGHAVGSWGKMQLLDVLKRTGSLIAGLT
jgi:acetyl esterase/lipase